MSLTLLTGKQVGTQGVSTHNKIQPDIFTLKNRSVFQSVMGDGPVQPVSIDTMLNNNGLNVGEGLNFVTCVETFSFNLIFS